MAFKTKLPAPSGKPAPAPKSEEKASSDPSKADSAANIKTTFGTPNE